MAPTRYEGKPLVDIHGKPMVWWVYQAAKNADGLHDVYIATDDERISKVCEQYKMKYLMTSKEHSTPTDRLHEVSRIVEADYYVCINGDEPLIDSGTISSAIPEQKYEGIFVSNLQ